MSDKPSMLTTSLSYSPKEMVTIAESYATLKVKRDSLSVFLLAISAGLFIGFAFVFYITVTTGSAAEPWGMVKLTGGLAFSIGLMLIVVCGGELFTSSILASISRASRKISAKQMLKNWLLVYVGNAVGALCLVGLIFGAKMHLLAGGQWGLTALNIATHKLEHDFIQAIILGFLCNVMVCLAIWKTFSTTDSVNKALLVMLPVALFVSGGFEHCIANLFMVPLGIVLKEFASADYFALIGKTAADFEWLTWSHFIDYNLIPVTLGNILGGLCVGLGFWLIYRRPN